MDIAQIVLGVAFNFLDKEMDYTTKTINTDMDSDKKEFFININISLHGRSELWKLNECLELFEKLDLFHEEQEEEKKD